MAQRKGRQWYSDTRANVSQDPSAAPLQESAGRISFCEWRRLYQRHGIDGLKMIPALPSTRAHMRTTPQEEISIVKCSLAHPSWGYVRVAACLKDEGIAVSPLTVQKILTHNQIARMDERCLMLEQDHLECGEVLTNEQLFAVEQHNPCFKERHTPSARPGALLCQRIFFINNVGSIGRVYVHACVDTYSSYAFALLHVDKSSACATALLQNSILPFFKEQGLSVQHILTGNSPEFCGNKNHPFEYCLFENQIVHLKMDRNANGFFERFKQQMLTKFFRSAPAKNPQSIEVLLDDLNQWLLDYNTAKPHTGYRNFGKPPIEAIREYLAAMD